MRVFVRRVRKARLLLVVLLIGAALRVLSLVIQSRLPLEPDASGTLALAESLDISDPWAASLREPGWIALVKAWCSVFGYSPDALRALTVALSVGLLLCSAALFYRHLRRRWALVATAMVSAHGLLVLGSGRGLREELVGILTILVARAVLERHSWRRPTAVLAAGVGAVAVVRWEIALLAVVLLLFGMVLRQVPVRFVAAGLAAAALTSGPWLVANDREYGTWQASSNQAATFWYRADVLGPEGVTAPASGSGQLVEGEMTWSRYYLAVLGPVETASRAAVGTAGLLHDLASRALWPLNDGWLEQNVRSELVRKVAVLARLVSEVAGWFVLAVVMAGLLRSRRLPQLGVVSLLVVLAGCTAYGPLRSLAFFEPRFIEFTIPFAAVLAASGLASLAGREDVFSPAQPSSEQAPAGGQVAESRA